MLVLSSRFLYLPTGSNFNIFQQGHEQLSGEFRGRQDIFMYLAALLQSEQFLSIIEWRCEYIGAWILKGITRIDETSLVLLVCRIHSTPQ